MTRKKWDDSSAAGQRGFTLIELLVVMIIIGLLAALVGPRMFKKLGKAKSQAAAGQIHLFEMALDTYRLDTGQYPERLEDLVNRPSGEDAWDGPYLKKGIIPKDPWKHDYYYAKQGDDFVLKAYGADGQPGGEGENEDVPADEQTETGTMVEPGEY